MKRVILVEDFGRIPGAGEIIIDPRRILAYSANEDLLSRAVVEFMNGIPSHIIEGKPIKEWFRLREHSLWWFAHSSLWRQIHESMRFIITFENMIDSIKPDVVELRGFYDKASIIVQICKEKNVTLSLGLGSRRRILIGSLKLQLAKIFLFKRRIIISRKVAKRVELASKAGHVDVGAVGSGGVVYLGHEIYRRPIFDFETGRAFKGEHIVQRILERIKAKGVDVLCIDVDHTFSGEFVALRHRLEDKEHYWLPFEALDDFSSKDELYIRDLVKNLRCSIINLLKKKSFQDIFSYNKISFWQNLEPRFKVVINETLPRRIRDIEVAKRLLKSKQPRSVFMLYERGHSGMVFIIAANELGIRTVGIQHGMIHKGHLDYAVGEVRDAYSSLGCPVPSVTVVFGEFYRRLLIEKFGYPPARVAVIGNPVYEYADEYINRLDKKALLAKHGLDSWKKTLLVATSMHQKKYGRPEYDVVMIGALIKAFANQSNIQVIIKFHPKEDETVYRKIIQESKPSNFLILSDPIEELLLTCDAFLVIVSTIILEAMVLGKPVIIAQASETVNRDLLSVLKNNAAIGATFDELREKIVNILYDERLRSELKERSAVFVKQYFNLPARDVSEKITEMLVGGSNTSV